MRTAFLWALSILAVVGKAAPAEVSGWIYRPAVIRASERLHENIERLDDRLHALQAPLAVINKAHGAEATVMRLVDAAHTASPAEVYRRYTPISVDLRLLQREMSRFPSLMRDRIVYYAWWDVRYAQHDLSHLMLEAGPFPDEPPPPPPPTGLSLKGVAYELVDKGTLVSTPTDVKGSGSLVVTQALKEGDNNYALALALEDKGAVTLVANADAKLEKGVKVTFAREGKRLKVTLAAGTQVDDLSDEFAEVPADAPLALSVDVHEHGHLIVWVGDGEEKEFGFTAPAGGNRWGLVLTQASVTEAKAGEPKEDHGHDHDDDDGHEH